ncbi:uncharacterized protein RJT20DRAFT_53113 [Scheffersomyces xylosifermentans]|uniref:uncharacterized protein n=1 Tax=Scheffersomyces xylosifermentans TaxID=1304137 RepID=UPI00315D1A89
MSEGNMYSPFKNHLSRAGKTSANNNGENTPSKRDSKQIGGMLRASQFSNSQNYTYSNGIDKSVGSKYGSVASTPRVMNPFYDANSPKSSEFNHQSGRMHYYAKDHLKSSSSGMFPLHFDPSSPKLISNSRDVTVMPSKTVRMEDVDSQPFSILLNRSDDQFAPKLKSRSAHHSEESKIHRRCSSPVLVKSQSDIEIDTAFFTSENEIINLEDEVINGFYNSIYGSGSSSSSMSNSLIWRANREKKTNYSQESSHLNLTDLDLARCKHQEDGDIIPLSYNKTPIGSSEKRICSQAIEITSQSSSVNSARVITAEQKDDRQQIELGEVAQPNSSHNEKITHATTPTISPRPSPPKESLQQAISSETDQIDPNIINEEHSVKAVEEIAPVVKRRRGRPPKNKGQPGNNKPDCKIETRSTRTVKSKHRKKLFVTLRLRNKPTKGPSKSRDSGRRLQSPSPQKQSYVSSSPETTVDKDSDQDYKPAARQTRSNNRKSRVTEEVYAPEKKRRLGPRSKRGCWTCRVRHKACPEDKPNCGQCRRLQLSCDYSEQRPAYMFDPIQQANKLRQIRQVTNEQKRINFAKRRRLSSSGEK